MDYDWILYIIMGVGVTIRYAFIPMFFSLILGIIITIMRLSNIRVLQYICDFYISIIRGTPLLLQLSIFYFALPQLLHIKMSTFLCGIIAFSINSSAYISEIIRAGIMAIDKGQFEAAQSLHIPYYNMMRDIIIPQAARNSIPSLINEAANLTKESAIVAIIGESDLTRRAQVVAAERYDYFVPMMVAAACYYLIVLLLSFIGSKLEEKLRVKY